jgi:hypothetical protein
MSVRWFCDGCGTEIPSDEFSHLRRGLQINGTKISIEVLVAVGGVWNSGNVCHKCIKLVAAWLCQGL